MPTFEVKTPVGVNQIWMKKQIKDAIAEATKRGKLRPNSVDSLTGENSGNNLGPGTPVIHFEQWERDDIEVKLLLKGGGCENMNAQYSLPAELAHLGRADRTHRRRAQVHPARGVERARQGLRAGRDRRVHRRRSHERLRRSEAAVVPQPGRSSIPIRGWRSSKPKSCGTANTLGVGPMGFGGKISLIGCKVGVQNRLPASFFVSVAYDCWAFRRLGVMLDGSTGAITQWIYRDPSVPTIPMMDQAGFKRTGREIALRAPIDEATIRSLKVGDVVLISGPRYTGRDAVHHHLASHAPPVDLSGGVIYHCGPVVAKQPDGGWKVTAAGPTTSIREEPYQADIIGKYGVRAVIGKGGMGGKTLAGLKQHGAVYLNAIGGAAQFYARCIDRVDGVSLLEFGTPEAMWHLQLREFPAIVTMDAHGNSLHKDLEQESGEKLAELAEAGFRPKASAFRVES